MIKITRLKKKSRLPELVKKMQALHGEQAKIGFFAGSGFHGPANMNYASLAFIHAFPINGYHQTRNWLDEVKPIRGERRNKVFFGDLLKQYISLKSTFTVEDVLDSIGAAWRQKADYVFGNAMILDNSWSSTPLVETGRLKRALSYKTSINYTLRYA